MTAVQRAWARVRALPASTVRWIVFAALCVPFLVAALALIGRQWYPVLDLAMTELRVRDVFTSNTPLIGLPGRIGRSIPEQGSHPGPLSFYLLAPVYRLFGSTSYGLEVGTLLLGVLAIGLALWLAQRRGGTRLVLVVGGLLAVIVRGYGLDVLAQPWNPYLPLLFWVVVLLAAWSVVAGEQAMLVLVVAAGSLCAQTHIPYLGLVIGITATCVVAMVVTWFLRPLERNPILHAWQWSVTVVAALWTPVLIDQLANSPGNVSTLKEHFSDPPEAVVGAGDATSLLLRHLDVFRLVGEAADGDGYLVRAGFDLTGSVWPGVLVLVAWIASFVVAVRLRERRLWSLHVVLAAALVLGWVSMARIFGKVWYYLTLWQWSTTLLIVTATVWTFATALSRRRAERPETRRAVRSAFVAVGAVVGVMSLVAVSLEATDVQPAEQHLSATLGALLDPTDEAIRAGTGAANGEDGTYLVTFRDAANFGSQAYGLVSELERRGLHVGMDEYWHVPITDHRVVSPLEATAEIQLVTGIYIDELRADPDAVEVAYVEPRDAAEMERFAALETALLARLEELGLDDLVPSVRENLFTVQIDPRVPRDVQETVDEMLHLGEATAVFVTPVTLTS